MTKASTFSSAVCSLWKRKLLFSMIWSSVYSVCVAIGSSIEMNFMNPNIASRTYGKVSICNKIL